MTPFITIKNCSVKRRDQLALRNINLNINHGESLAVLGPNGAGKSSLIKLLGREIYPLERDDSYIHIRGEKHIIKRDYRADIGVVSPDLQQNYHPATPGLEVVISGFFDSNSLWQHYEITREQRSSAEAIMDKLGIVNILSTPFDALSTGQQRRLLLARALVHQPRTLILDEPTTGLDIAASFQYLEIIRQLISEGIAIILVTHHLHEIPPQIKRIILLQKGSIVADGSRESLLTEKRLSELFQCPICLNEVNGDIQAHPK